MKIQYPAEGEVTQDFYTPVNYIAGRSYHEALDIVTSTFEHLKALFSGSIYIVIDDVENYAVYSSTNYTGYGNEVWQVSDNGRVMLRVCHNKKGCPVREGEYVEPNTIIGTTGQTGYRVPDDIIHTHYEIYIDGIRHDPEDWIGILLALESKSLTIDNMSSLEDIAKAQEVILKTLKEHTVQIARLQKSNRRVRNTVLNTVAFVNKKGAGIKTRLQRPKKKSKK